MRPIVAERSSGQAYLCCIRYPEAYGSGHGIPAGSGAVG